MNNKDLAFLRKQFKPELTLAEINNIYSVYLIKDNKEVLDAKELSFNNADEKVKDALLTNIKKVITGTIGQKLFIQEFDEELKSKDFSTHSLLQKILEVESNEQYTVLCDNLVEKFQANYTYETGVVINFYKVKIFNDLNGFKFLICSVNKVEPGKPNYIYDYAKKEFNVRGSLDAVVEMENPLEGFMYPVFEFENINLDAIVEYNPKTSIPFTTGVLECNTALTAKEENECFHQVLYEINGGKIEAEKLQGIYEVIAERFDDKEERLITPRVLGNIISDLEIETEADIEESYSQAVPRENYLFNVDSILPKETAKSIQLETETAEIKIKPEELKNIKQFKNEKGEIFALIKLSENLKTKGINVKMSDINEIISLIQNLDN